MLCFQFSDDYFFFWVQELLPAEYKCQYLNY